MRQPSFQQQEVSQRYLPVAVYILHECLYFVNLPSLLSLQLDFCLIYRSLANHQETFIDTLRPIYPLSNMNCQQVRYDDYSLHQNNV